MACVGGSGTGHFRLSRNHLPAATGRCYLPRRVTLWLGTGDPRYVALPLVMCQVCFYRCHDWSYLGLGGNVVDWIAYGHVKQSAKDNSEFGKGDTGMAPESANNAKEGGGLIPTLLFASRLRQHGGIPRRYGANWYRTRPFHGQ